METNFEHYAKLFKALSDPKRLKILDMLSDGELCACKILEEFQITQPTLSHDMKLLCDAGLVFGRKEGKWMRYSLNLEQMNDVYKTIGRIMVPSGFERIVDCGCERGAEDAAASHGGEGSREGGEIRVEGGLVVLSESDTGDAMAS